MQHASSLPPAMAGPRSPGDRGPGHRRRHERLGDRWIAAVAVLALACELWALLSDVHFLWKPQAATLPRVVVATVESTAARARLRSPLALSWEDAHPGTVLHEGDEIATLDDAKATIVFTNQQRLTLGPNSLLVVRRGQSLVDRVFRLALIRGTLLESKGSGAAPAPAAGHLEIEIGGHKVVTHGDDGFRLQTDPRAALQLPVALSPASVPEPRRAAARILGRPRLLRPQIEQAEPADTHRLKPPELKRPEIQYRGGSLGFRVLNMACSALLGAIDARAAEASAAEAPGAPSGASATEAERPSRYTVKLNWLPVPGAHAYALQIATEPGFRRLVAEKVLVEPGYSWRTSVAGYYYWRVSAIDAEGDRGPYSEYMAFDIKADKNVAGDETSYETFLRFDEYSGHDHQFRVLVGPNFIFYHSSSADTETSPDNVRYHTHAWRQLQLEYAYRLDSHYSAQATLKTAGHHLDASSFDDRPQQNTLTQNETVVSLGLERRYFQPTHYFTLQTGIRASFLDIPTKDSDTELTLTNMSFIGAYVFGGYNLRLRHNWELDLRGGPVFQYVDQSYRYGGIFWQQIGHSVNDIFSFGVRLNEDLRFFKFGADYMSGYASMTVLDALLFAEFNF